MRPTSPKRERVPDGVQLYHTRAHRGSTKGTARKRIFFGADLHQQAMLTRDRSAGCRVEGGPEIRGDLMSSLHLTNIRLS